ncbi:MAG: VOC family protein [Propionicimonas sp.]
MLSDYPAMATLAVSDLKRAREFYEGVLGLTPTGEPPDGVLYGAGAGAIFVYPSAYAGTNKATAVSFQVPEDAFDAEVDALRAKGVTYQTFEAEGLAWSGDVAAYEGMRSVWFTDPDGNTINLETMN